MRALIAMFLAASLAGCCVGGYPPVWTADRPPFNAFQAGMKLAVGMPTDVALLMIGWAPVSSKATSCGILTGYEWPCEVLKFRLLRGQPTHRLYRPDPGRPRRRELLGFGQEFIRAAGRFDFRRTAKLGHHRGPENAKRPIALRRASRPLWASEASRIRPVVANVVFFNDPWRLRAAQLQHSFGH